MRETFLAQGKNRDFEDISILRLTGNPLTKRVEAPIAKLLPTTFLLYYMIVL